MKIGIECFRDPEIRSMIQSINHKGKCDITEKETFVFDTDTDDISTDISDDITEIMDVYSPESELPDSYDSSKLDTIENHLAYDWAIFQIAPDKIREIISTLCNDSYPSTAKIYHEKVGIEKLSDAAYLQDYCIVRDSSWESFRNTIKTINRFHVSNVNLNILKELLESESLDLRVSKGERRFFRARIGSEKPFSTNEMGPPPAEKASAGRANSRGISCLYLAGDIETTFHEIRARDLDYVSVGEFINTSEIRIVDLTKLDQISPFAGSFNMDWFAVNMRILLKISEEIAKPLRRTDSELDYLPAQYIADYIKSLGFDGMSYRSTLHNGGINYAIFSSQKFRCESVELYQITSIEYRHEPV